MSNFKTAGILVTLAFAAVLTATDVAIQNGSEHDVFLRRLVAAAVERAKHVVRYDPGYVRIPYPGGDVPADTGVCTDEIIRAYRVVGVDLQKDVHEDMAANFAAYPSRAIWGL